MIIQCDQCQTKYKYDEARFEGKPSKKIKCAKCQAVFEIHNPALAEREAPTVEASGDSTAMKRDGRPGKPSADDGGERGTVQIGALGTPEIERTGRISHTTDMAAIRRDASSLNLLEGFNYSVAILDGTDAGKIFPITKPRMTIGRSSADIVLNDTEVSRNHAAIEVHSERVLLLDLESTNGTFVDEERIQEAELTNHSEFLVGSSTLMLIVTARE